MMMMMILKPLLILFSIFAQLASLFPSSTFLLPRLAIRPTPASSSTQVFSRVLRLFGINFPISFYQMSNNFPLGSGVLTGSPTLGLSWLQNLFIIILFLEALQSLYSSPTRALASPRGILLTSQPPSRSSLLPHFPCSNSLEISLRPPAPPSPTSCQGGRCYWIIIIIFLISIITTLTRLLPRWLLLDHHHYCRHHLCHHYIYHRHPQGGRYLERDGSVTDRVCLTTKCSR